jgi:hypothetical protein
LILSVAVSQEEFLIDSCSFVLVVLAVVSHGLLQECRGGLGDDERHPPRLIVKEKVKGP